MAGVSVRSEPEPPRVPLQDVQSLCRRMDQHHGSARLKMYVNWPRFSILRRLHWCLASFARDAGDAAASSPMLELRDSLGRLMGKNNDLWTSREVNVDGIHDEIREALAFFVRGIVVEDVPVDETPEFIAVPEPAMLSPSLQSVSSRPGARTGPDAGTPVRPATAPSAALLDTPTRTPAPAAAVVPASDNGGDTPARESVRRRLIPAISDAAAADDAAHAIRSLAVGSDADLSETIAAAATASASITTSVAATMTDAPPLQPAVAAAYVVPCSGKPGTVVNVILPNYTQREGGTAPLTMWALPSGMDGKALRVVPLTPDPESSLAQLAAAFALPVACFRMVVPPLSPLPPLAARDGDPAADAAATPEPLPSVDVSVVPTPDSTSQAYHCTFQYL